MAEGSRAGRSKQKRMIAEVQSSLCRLRNYTLPCEANISSLRSSCSHQDTDHGKDGDEAAQQQQQQQQQQEAALAHVSVPFLTAFQHAQGHPGMSLSPADLALLQQQNLFFQQQAQQHVQQQFENEQRDKNVQGLMQGADGLNLQALTAGQQGGEQGQPIHDIDFEKERKEKRKVANREAARRMRQRRSEQLGSLSANNDGLKVENQQLQHQIAQIAGQNRDLVAENAQLKEELLALKQQMMTIKNPANGEAGPASAIES